MAVFTCQRPDGTAEGRGKRRRRRHSPTPLYHWHLIQDERPFTWCGLEFSYPFSRRLLWAETPEDQRCQSCKGRHEEMGRTNTNQTPLQSSTNT
jgi:hypothetical protein